MSDRTGDENGRITAAGSGRAQDALLKQAMKQPGVSGLMDAYSTIESAYSHAAAATAIEPVVITTNTSR